MPWLTVVIFLPLVGLPVLAVWTKATEVQARVVALVFSLATETLLGIDEDIPPRAQWIRMLLCELNRMSSHLLFLATNGMDMGAVSMMIFGWREREETLRLLEMITGLRMNHNFIRPGGVAADLPDGWRDATLRVLDLVEPRLPAGPDHPNLLGIPTAEEGELHRVANDIADEIVCARAPEYFAAVGQWYRDFAQTTDEEVRHLLHDAPAIVGRPS